MDIEKLVRPNILKLKPYSSARHEFTGKGEVFLDANENPFESSVNRYPDPLQWPIKGALSTIKKVSPDSIFLGNGSDESIDLIIRIFCEPAKDEIMVLPPTYGMYQVSADIADVSVKKIPLKDFFQPDLDKISRESSEFTKVLFLCSPNNPTGNVINRDAIVHLLETFRGIVVIDEAYIDFCPEKTCVDLIEKYPRLIIMQTLSKAWGMAAIRLGMAISSKEIISLFNKVKAPYNINILTQRYSLDRLLRQDEMLTQVKMLNDEKERLFRELPKLHAVLHVYPSDANYILTKMKDADQAYRKLVENGVVVRNRSKEPGCENCLRITVGTKLENDVLLNALSTLN
ncbi:MAG: histidinol-phosphate transaminase [Saprospiraceae bacterium]